MIIANNICHNRTKNIIAFKLKQTLQKVIVSQVQYLFREQTKYKHVK